MQDDNDKQCKALKDRIKALERDIEALQAIRKRQGELLLESFEREAMAELKYNNVCTELEVDRDFTTDQRNGLIHFLTTIFAHRLEKGTDAEGNPTKWIIVELPSGVEVQWRYHHDLESGFDHDNAKKLEDAALYIAKILNEKNGPAGK